MGIALIQIESDNDRKCRSFATFSGSAVIQLVVTATQGLPTANRDARTLSDLWLEPHVPFGLLVQGYFDDMLPDDDRGLTRRRV